MSSAAKDRASTRPRSPTRLSADRRWPALRDRLCEPGPVLRPHINVFVDCERAALDSPLAADSRLGVIAAISGR